VSRYLLGLRCVHCETAYPDQAMGSGCPTCRTDTFASGVTPDYDYERMRRELDGRIDDGGVGLWRYRHLLPLGAHGPEITLGEGNTPLVPMPSLAAELRAEEVWIKDESRNPTWTFKDRNAAVTVSKAVQFGAKTIVVSTSGNHGASTAAYAARAGLDCVVLTYPGIPDGTRTLIEATGAELVVTEPDRRWTLMAEGMREHGWYPASNYTPIPTNGAYGHEGYKTIAYEVAEQLGDTPDVMSIPTALGEGLFGIWKGYEELQRLGITARTPQMIACEPAGGPLLPAMQDPEHPLARVSRRATVARGIGGAVNSYIAVVALRASAGKVAQADDDSVIAAMRDLAAEGLFVEPASAAALAGLRNLARADALPSGLRIVIVSTSSGLKNYDAILARKP